MEMVQGTWAGRWQGGEEAMMENILARWGV